MTEPAVQHLSIDTEAAGQRLDNFLLRHLKGVPKSHVYRIIRSGEVRVNKGRAEALTKLRVGDVVRLPPLRVPDRPAQAIGHAVAPRQFRVLHEDEHFIALDKPAGVAVHGGSGVSFGVIEQLRAARPGAPLLELVHRLDRETSGVLLVAKKRSALRHLQDQFRGRTTDKRYLALALGAWPARLNVIDQALCKYTVATGDGEGERRVKAVAPNDPDGQRSISLVRPLLTTPEHSLLLVTLKTGRTHQIRVHLAHHGHPIAGDDKYGDFDANKRLAKAGLKRMYLHAWRLAFDHPASGERVHLVAPLPAELASFVDVPQGEPAALPQPEPIRPALAVYFRG